MVLQRHTLEPCIAMLNHVQLSYFDKKDFIKNTLLSDLSDPTCICLQKLHQ